jgi:hypothetical protein
MKIMITNCERLLIANHPRTNHFVCPIKSNYDYAMPFVGTTSCAPILTQNHFPTPNRHKLYYSSSKTYCAMGQRDDLSPLY